MSLPYALMPVCRQQFLDPDGDPYAGGTLYFYIAGTSTPKAVYSTSAGSVSLGTSITLDAGGYAPAIYLAPGGYKVSLYDADAVLVWTQDVVEDVAITFLDELGLEWSTGGSDVTSGYTILSSDRLVTVDSTGGADPCQITLCNAASHSSPLCIKNMGTVTIEVWPYVGDTIEGSGNAYTIPAAVDPLFPAIWLLSDGGSAWHIIASHGIA